MAWYPAQRQYLLACERSQAVSNLAHHFAEKTEIGPDKVQIARSD
jgi:hypothetical protein